MVVLSTASFGSATFGVMFKVGPRHSRLGLQKEMLKSKNYQQLECGLCTGENTLLSKSLLDSEEAPHGPDTECCSVFLPNLTESLSFHMGKTWVKSENSMWKQFVDALMWPQEHHAIFKCYKMYNLLSFAHDAVKGCPRSRYIYITCLTL